MIQIFKILQYYQRIKEIYIFLNKLKILGRQV